MTTTSDKGVNVIKAFEGCALRAYRDPVGVWTIGYGLTNMDTNLPWKIQAGLTITQDEADTWLHRSLRDRYEPGVAKNLPGVDQPTFDAGVSFHYNTGAIAKASWPKKLRAGDAEAARVSILSWNKGGGRVLAGLTRRRQREWAMIANKDYGPEGRGGQVVMITKHEDTGQSTGAPKTAAPTTPVGPGMLGLHDVGPEVRELQEDLVALRLLPKGSSTGTFDAPTEAAVKAFQRAHKQLRVDGVVGPATRSAIARDLKATGKASAAVKTAAAATSAGAVVWKMTALKTLGIALACFAGVVVVGVGVYLLARYRDELGARINRMIGREA